VWGWHTLLRPDPLQTSSRLTGALLQLLTPAQLDALRQRSLGSPRDNHTNAAAACPTGQAAPDWNIVWSRQLLEQAQTLWPEQAKPLAQQWQQQFTAASLPAENLNGWYQGMTTLHKLSDRLNRLDEQKGKYMTVKAEIGGLFRHTVLSSIHTR
jgi:type VI secretion system protein VasL